MKDEPRPTHYALRTTSSSCHPFTCSAAHGIIHLSVSDPLSRLPTADGYESSASSALEGATQPKIPPWAAIMRSAVAWKSGK